MRCQEDLIDSHHCVLCRENRWFLLVRSIFWFKGLPNNCLTSLVISLISFLPECFSSQPLGMINGKIADNQITASSHAPGFPPNKARARGNSCWRSANNTLGEYLEINFGRKRFVYTVEIDKDPQADSWTEQFFLEYYTGTVWRNVSRPYGGVRVGVVLTSSSFSTTWSIIFKLRIFF